MFSNMKSFIINQWSNIVSEVWLIKISRPKVHQEIILKALAGTVVFFLFSLDEHLSHFSFMIHLKNFYKYIPIQNLTSLVAQTVKHLSTMWETWVWSLDWENSLEKEMATYSSTLALKIPWTEELGAGYYPWGHKESGTTEQLHFLYTKFEKWKID